MQRPLHHVFIIMCIAFAFDGQAQYCAAGGQCQTEWISNVSFESITNSSVCSSTGYTDYTAFTDTAKLEVGIAYTLNVSLQPSENCFVTAWIDWNQNGSFFDPGEAYSIATATSSSGPHSISITPPANAVLGNTTMRVGLRWASPPAPCITTGFGEYEDYSVSLSPGCNLFLSASSTNETCSGYGDGAISLSVTGAVPPYSILWNTGATTATITNLSRGIYTVEVTDQNCTKELTYVLEADAIMEPDPIGGKDTVLSEATQVYYTNPNGLWSYQWRIPLGAGFIRQGTSTHVATITWTKSGIHKLSCFVYSQSGCIDSTQLDVYVSATVSNYLDELDFVKYYPNPVRDFLQIDAIPNAITAVEVYSMQGQLLLHQAVENTPTIQLDFTSLSPGNYFLRIGDKFFKIVKI